jgi:hypothetical protein
MKVTKLGRVYSIMLHISGSLTCQILVKYVEGFVDTWKIPFMAICKLGFIMDKYSSKSELPDNFW